MALLAGMLRETAEGQDYTYTTNTGTATITRYIGPGGNVSIPPTIDGLAVTSIGDSAFGFCYSVTSIATPDTVTNIGQLAFVSCLDLTNIFISAGVAGIGQVAFKNCSSLAAIAVDTNNPVFSSADGVLFDKNQTAVIEYPPGQAGASFVVPGSVQTIGVGAFFGCLALTNVTLPGGLKDIEDTAFYGCAGLAGIVIPEGVTNLGAQAFLNCENLQNIVVPDSVVSLGTQAFFSCGSLTNATVGNGVAGIEDNTFADCTNLVTATIGDNAASIGDSAFEYCYSLSDIRLGNRVASIGDSAFSYCFDLPAIALPASLTSIASHAFQFCDLLSLVNLPAGVTNIGDRVFEFCSGLVVITVDPANPAYAGIDGVLFDKRAERLVMYPPNSPRTSYVVPAGTRIIGDTAFVSAFNLTSVTLPASLTNLETLAFYDCAEATGFFFEGNAPTLGSDVFVLDDAATVFYLEGTTGWGPAYGGLPTALWDPVIHPAPEPVKTRPFGFEIIGNTNTPVVVEACTNLTSASWTVIQSLILTNGSLHFCDPLWTNYPSRYYRVRSP